LKPTKDLLQALCNLRASTDFKVFLQACGEELESARDACEKHTADEKLYRSQGRASAFREVTELYKQAPDKLGKIKP